MNFLHAPTDTLYKYMTICGLVLVLFAVYFCYTQRQKLQEPEDKISLEITSLAADISHEEKILKSQGDVNGLTAGELRKLQSDLRRHNDLIGKKYQHLNKLHNEKIMLLYGGGIGIFIGLLFICSGFFLWFFSLKNNQDTAIRSDTLDTEAAPHRSAQPNLQEAAFDRATKDLEGHSYKATIIASIVATFTLLLGLMQFWITQEIQREALEFDREFKTVEMFKEYANLMQEEAKNAAAANAKNTEAEVWVGNSALFFAETIHKFNSGWHETVKSMLRGHRDFIIKERLDCHTYTEEFITFTKGAIGTEDICKI